MSINKYTKYGFHTGLPLADETEVFSMLVSEKGKVMFVKNDKTLFYHSLNFRRYVQGSVKNISEGPFPEWDFNNMSNPPVLGEHLVTKSNLGFRTDITDLVITEINNNFELDSDLINGKYKK